MLVKFKHGKFLCFQNATYQPKSIAELVYMWPWELSGPPAMILTK